MAVTRKHMSADEARAARELVGAAPEDIAAELGVTPHVVEAWESGRIAVPVRIADHLRWRAAAVERQQALAASGLPECDWVTAFNQQPAPANRREQGAQMERLLAHMKHCPVCEARERFLAEQFGPMPQPPRPAWASALVWIIERVRRLPRWARPAASGALLFFAYSLLKLLASLPVIVHDPGRELPVTAVGMAVSVTIGAVLGLIYGQIRAFRDGRRTRPG